MMAARHTLTRSEGNVTRGEGTRTLDRPRRIGDSISTHDESDVTHRARANSGPVASTAAATLCRDSADDTSGGVMSEIEPFGTPQRPWQPPPTAPSPAVPPPPTVQAPPPSPAVWANTTRAALPATDRRQSTAVTVIAWVVTVLTVGYMLPWAIAASRGRSNQAAIGLLNFLLGWTLIGWIVALVMACQAHQVIGTGPAMVVSQHIAGPSAVPPGWYPSPYGPGRQYWDGTTWTNHHAP